MINMDEEFAKRINNAFVPDRLPCIVATASKDGEPSLGPKGSMMVLDPQHLAYWERTRRGTLHNLEENPRIAVFYRHPADRINWRFHGTVTIHKDGPLREEVMRRTIPQEMERDPERQGYAVIIEVDKIVNVVGEVMQER